MLAVCLFSMSIALPYFRPFKNFNDSFKPKSEMLNNPSKHLSIDVGSSSIKMVLFDDNLSVNGIFHSESYSSPHLYELEFEEIWQRLKNLLSCLPEKNQISSIFITTFVTNMIGLDEKGCQITPILSYQGKTRSNQSFDIKF